MELRKASPRYPTAEDAARLLESVVQSGVRPFQNSCVTSPIGRRAGSVIFRCTCQTFPIPLAVKFCWNSISGEPDRTDAIRQFSSLERLANAASEQPLVRAPRPIMLLEEHACLIMEWIDGIPMADALTRPFASKEKLGALASKAGIWLSSFHNMSPGQDRPVATELLLARLKAALESTHVVAGNRQFESGLVVLERSARRVAEIAIPAAWRHGDIKPQNFIIADDSLVAIDLSTQDDDAVTSDIAKFISDVEFLSWHPRGWNLGRHRNYVINCFTSGYMASRSFQLEPSLAWTRLYLLLSFWRQFEVKASASPSDWYQRWRFRSATNRAISELRSGIEE